MNYMTVAQLYEWTKERGLENKCILTFNNYGELSHYVDSGEIEVKGEDLVIQLVENQLFLCKNGLQLSSIMI